MSLKMSILIHLLPLKPCTTQITKSRQGLGLIVAVLSGTWRQMVERDWRLVFFVHARATHPT